MTSAEQQQWLADFQQWAGVSLPSIEAEWGAGAPELMKQGLTLVSAFSYGEQLASPIIRTHNYHPKFVKVLRLVCERIIKELQQRGVVQSGAADAASNVLVLTPTGEVNPQLLTRHVGRPTLKEQQARAIQAERERQASDAQQPPIFVSSPAIPAAPQTLSGTVMGGQMLHLDQLRGFMSPQLAKDIESIRELRALHASAAERAKTLADAQSATDPDPALKRKIAEYAQESRHYADQYTGIYARVDDEMATCYVRLKEDTAYQAEMQAKGYKIQELRTLLRPYYDKKGAAREAFKQKVIEAIMAADPKQAAKRKAEEERRNRITMIVKYLTRTDKANTPTRLATMAKRVEELATLIPEEQMQKYRDVLAYAQEHPAPTKKKSNP